MIDEEGNKINYIDVIDESGEIGDGLDNLSSFSIRELGEPESPSSSYSCLIPESVSRLHQHTSSKSDQSDPSNFRKKLKDVPPLLPAQLNRVILNSKSVPNSNQDPHFLPLPSGSALNHLYACSIRDGIMAIATTTRYRKKVLKYL